MYPYNRGSIPLELSDVARLDVSCANGVPFRTERWFIAYCPVSKDALAGPHGLVTEKWFRKLTDSFLNWVKFGSSIVSAKGPIRASARIWSKTIKRMFGRGFLIGFDLRKLR